MESVPPAGSVQQCFETALHEAYPGFKLLISNESSRDSPLRPGSEPRRGVSGRPHRRALADVRLTCPAQHPAHHLLIRVDGVHAAAHFPGDARGVARGARPRPRAVHPDRHGARRGEHFGPHAAPPPRRARQGAPGARPRAGRGRRRRGAGSRPTCRRRDSGGEGESCGMDTRRDKPFFSRRACVESLNS